MKNKIDTISATISIVCCAISNIICMNYLKIEPAIWNSIVSLVISLITSYGLIYLLIRNIVIAIYNKKSNQYIGGKWYIAYHSNNYSEDKYLRFGTFNIKQTLDFITMEHMETHTPKINSAGECKYGEFCDDIPSEHSSTGSGFAKIDLSNRTLIGIFELHRSQTQSIKGMWETQITEDKDIIRGSFMNLEENRKYGKPIKGKFIMFRKELDLINYCNDVISNKI